VVKFWLCGITNSGNSDNLKELIQPVLRYFDGLVWTFHKPEDEGLDYLESVKADGKIVCTDWVGRYDFARNHYLFSNVIKEGDWFFNIDSEERLSPHFMENFEEYVKTFEANQIDGLYYEGKFLAFKLNEWMFWRNSIHETLEGVQKPTDLKGAMPFDEKPIRVNLRKQKRQEFAFVKQALRYYLTKGSIHCLLGCEKNQDFFKQRMQVRDLFRKNLIQKEIDPTDTDQVLNYIVSDDIDQTTRDAINFEKYLNDAYRYHKLNKADFEQDFDFKNLIKI